jgi:hypothetical protein
MLCRIEEVGENQLYCLIQPTCCFPAHIPWCVLSIGSHHKDVRLQVQQLTEREYVYVERNVELRSRNHCCLGKATSITHSERVFVALVIQHAKRIRLLWSVRLHSILLHFLVNGMIFL